MYNLDMSEYSGTELFKLAQCKQLASRAKSTSPQQQFISFVSSELFHENTDSKGANDHTWSKGVLYTLFPDDGKSGDSRSIIELCMKNIKPDRVHEIKRLGGSILGYAPSGVPLIDHISYRVSQLPWWENILRPVISDIQSVRSITTDYSFSTFTIVVGSTSPKKVSKWIGWIDQMCKDAQTNVSCSSDIVADVKFVELFWPDLKTRGRKIGNIPLQKAKNDAHRTLNHSVPAALVLSGPNFMAVLKLPFEVHGVGAKVFYTYRSHLTIQPELLDYLNSRLPTLVGFEIREKMIKFEKMLNTNHMPKDQAFSVGGLILELDYLGYVAGMYNSNPSFDHINFATTGGILLNKTIESLDGVDYVAEDTYKDEVYLVYIFGYNRAIYNTYMTLKMSLMIDGFPDLVAASQVSQLSPTEVTKWFSAVVSYVATGRSADPELADMSMNRTELMRAFQNSKESDDLQRPVSIEDFASLFESKPSLVFSGNRFLHDARRCVTEFGKLVNGVKPFIVDYTWNTADPDYISKFVLFNQFDKDEVYDWRDSQISESEPGGLAMFYNLTHKNDPLSGLNPASDGTSKAEFVQLKRRTDRDFRVRLYEWGMMNPSKIESLLRRIELPMQDENKYVVNNFNVVVSLKDLHRRIFGVDLEVNPFKPSDFIVLRNLFNKHKVLDEEAKVIKRKVEALETREADVHAKRVAVFSSLTENFDRFGDYEAGVKIIKRAVNPVPRPGSSASMSVVSSSGSTSGSSTIMSRPGSSASSLESSAGSRPGSSASTSSSGLSKGQRKKLNKRRRLQEISAEIDPMIESLLDKEA